MEIFPRTNKRRRHRRRNHSNAFKCAWIANFFVSAAIVLAIRDASEKKPTKLKLNVFSVLLSTFTGKSSACGHNRIENHNRRKRNAEESKQKWCIFIRREKWRSSAAEEVNNKIWNLSQSQPRSNRCYSKCNSRANNSAHKMWACRCICMWRVLGIYRGFHFYSHWMLPVFVGIGAALAKVEIKQRTFSVCCVCSLYFLVLAVGCGFYISAKWMHCDWDNVDRGRVPKKNISVFTLIRCSYLVSAVLSTLEIVIVASSTVYTFAWRNDMRKQRLRYRYIEFKRK